MKKNYRSNTQKAYLRLIGSRLILFRRQLATVDALPQLIILGLVSGIFTGVVIVLFRWIIETTLSSSLPGGDPENFEGLPMWLQFAVPVLGALLIGGTLQLVNKDWHRVGLSHVINRFNNHQGNLPLGNALVQFFGGILAIVSGQSVGREGPAVHLGATCSSLIGQWFRLPNNSIRILVGCGVAAAVSASFHTPIAGVIFAMEVVMMEYSIAGFTPIIIASVTGAVISQAVYGAEPAFIVPPIQMQSLFEIPFIVLTGCIVGAAAAFFISLQKKALALQSYPISLRLTVAGVITGSAAIYLPQIMGIGYDTVQLALTGSLAINYLLITVIVKLCLTAICIGMGMPGGVIGPTFFIGACIGGIMGTIGHILYPAYAATSGFYVMLGMAAMMGACLNAPLAALMAVVEMTSNTNIILPAMLVIVTANLTRTEFFKQPTVFDSFLLLSGTASKHNPFYQVLQRTAVSSIMDRNLRVAARTISIAEAEKLLSKAPRWIVTSNDNNGRVIFKTADLARYIEEQNEPAEFINLLDMPSSLRKDAQSISIRATLAEALETLNSANVDAVCIERQAAPMRSPVIGIVRREDIFEYYQFSPTTP